MDIMVDLFSDTGTKPSKEMRQFMAEAEVGDEQLGEDPTVNRLCSMAADLLGKEEAVYLPSGLMANQISYAVHCQPGDEIIMDKTAHPVHYEGGATAVIAGASIRTVPGEHGIFSLTDLVQAVRKTEYHNPLTRVVSVEQTSNLGGGRVWPLERIEEVTKYAREKGLKTHMDGARLLNAVIASGVPARTYGQYFDSIWFDLSKGLGAPVGSVLAGSAEFIEEARFWKQRLGGAMRQAGIIAAGGVYALENNVERLADDHLHARKLAEGISELAGLEIELDNVETNIVLFKVKDNLTEEFANLLLEKGVRVSSLAGYLRAVTHLDVGQKDIDFALEKITETAGEIFK